MNIRFALGPAGLALLLALALASGRAETGGPADTVRIRQAEGGVPGWLLGRGTGAQAPEPIPPDAAFTLTVTPRQARQLALRFDVHDCCYLYRDELRFALAGADGAPGAPLPRLGTVQLPPAETASDAYFGQSAVYRGHLDLQLPLLDLPADAAFVLEVTYQGCSEKGVVLCYEPITRRVHLRTLGERLIVERFGAASPAS